MHCHIKSFGCKLRRTSSEDESDVSYLQLGVGLAGWWNGALMLLHRKHMMLDFISLSFLWCFVIVGPRSLLEDSVYTSATPRTLDGKNCWLFLLPQNETKFVTLEECKRIFCGK